MQTASIGYADRLPQVEDSSRARDVADYVAIYGADAVKNREFLNIGAGRWRHPAWRNVDFWQPSYEALLKTARPDIDHDLSKLTPIPAPDASIHLAFTSHTIEHIADDMVQFMFEDAHRYLRPGGIIRITCPNAELAWHAMKAGDIRYFRTFGLVRVMVGKVIHQETTVYGHFRKTPDVELALLQQLAVQAAKDPARRKIALGFLRTLPMEEALSAVAGLLTWKEHMTNPGHHVNWFTPAKVERMLRVAGFRTVIRSGAHQSISPVLRNKFYFNKMRPNFSLYVEAVKDGGPAAGFADGGLR